MTKKKNVIKRENIKGPYEKKEKEVVERKTKKQVGLYAKESNVHSVFYTNRLMFVFLQKKTCFNTNDIDLSLPSIVVHLLQKYKNVFPDDVPSGLPLIMGIKYKFDIIHGVIISNQLTYRSDLMETNK